MTPARVIRMAAHDFKQKIIEELTVLVTASKGEPNGGFKSRAYVTAIKRLSELGPIYAESDVPDLPGIGVKVRAKIAEIITTGHLAAADKGRQIEPALKAFGNIYGVGPKAAQDLVSQGFRTIDEIRASTTVKLTKNQQVGLRVYDDLLLRIPRAEMEEHQKLLSTGTIVGSFRRGQPTSGDIDVLLTEGLAETVTALTTLGYITDILAQGPSKCLAVCRLPGKPHRRLDFLLTPTEELPFAILYFTGSDTFNVAMRQKASDMGFRLNEHGLLHTKTNKYVTGIRTEKDIFTILKMDWKEPHER